MWSFEDTEFYENVCLEAWREFVYGINGACLFVLNDGQWD